MLVAALAVFLQHGLNSLRLLFNNTFEQKVIFDLRSDLYSHIQLLPLRWFDNRATGDLMTRIIEDVTSVERVLIDGIEQGTVAVLQIVIVLAGMFYLSRETRAGRAGAGAVSGWRRPLVHPHCTSALSVTTPRRAPHEFYFCTITWPVFVRSRALCANARNTSFQRSERHLAPRHSRGDESLGSL